MLLCVFCRVAALMFFSVYEIPLLMKHFVKLSFSGGTRFVFVLLL